MGGLCILVQHLKLGVLISYEGGSDQQIYLEFSNFLQGICRGRFEGGSGEEGGVWGGRGCEGARPSFLLQSLVFFCNHFEELKTVLFELELIVNNKPLTHVYPNTIEIIWQTIIIFF